MNGFSFVAGGVLALCLISSAWADNKVKVRLKTKIGHIALSGFQIRMPYDSADAQKFLGFHRRKVGFQRVLQNGKIVWEIADSQLPEKVYWRDESLKIEGEMMRQGIEPLPKTLILYPLDTKAFDVVASLDIESYLAGVLPSEMPSGWPMEALKAQVVASRSYMLSLMAERKNQHFHLESSVFDQVYKHENRVEVTSVVRKRMLRAIRETEGDVLWSTSGEVYRAFYHADCGGKTEEPRYVWGMNTVNGTVEDEGCPASPQATWELSLNRKSLRRYLSDFLGRKNPLSFKSVLVAQRTPSGRVAELEVLFEDSDSVRLSAQDFRKMLGYNRLKSTNFQLSWFGEQLKIEGQGHGHGVGMCQWGAKSLAKRGMNYRDILKRYYPYTRIGKTADEAGSEKITSNL